jgi:hypothetical protein
MNKQASSPQMAQAVRQLFERYEGSFNAGLKGEVDLPAVAALYADSFIAASPSGLFTGKNDEELKKVTVQGFKHYRETGVQQMVVRDLHLSVIDALHGLARVEWSATYQVKGQEKIIAFTNVYLVRLEGATARVFGWITGDEEALLRQHGIV